jgi:DNA-binding PadR family transcriptional regulator
MHELTPTSCALLALLSIRPWSAYDLTGYMRGSTLRAVWPRAESRIYAEVKRLEASGLASSHVERQGGRKRSVYSINAEGEAALRDWLQSPSKRFVYESEAMLKIAYADKGGLDDLLATLASIRSETRQDLEIMATVFAHIVDDATRILPGRTGYNAMVSRHILEVMEARLRWVDFADAYVASWTNVESDATKEAQGSACYAEMLERVRKLLD